MWIDKADTWRLAQELGGESLTQLIVEETHTCYLGERGKRFDMGLWLRRLPRLPVSRSGMGKVYAREAARGVKTPLTKGSGVPLRT